MQGSAQPSFTDGRANESLTGGGVSPVKATPLCTGADSADSSVSIFSIVRYSAECPWQRGGVLTTSGIVSAGLAEQGVRGIEDIQCGMSEQGSAFSFAAEASSTYRGQISELR